MNSLIDSLCRAYSKDRLGHGTIFNLNTPSNSEQSFEKVRPLVEKILCETADSSSKACSNCSSCKLFQSSKISEINHSDFYFLSADDSIGYTVDQIKQAVRFLHLKAQGNNNKLLLITEADKLSANGGSSANALLKSLEEPSQNTFIFLTSSRLSSILGTIRSRCQSYHFPLAMDVNSAADVEIMSDWSSLLAWLNQGAPENSVFSCPADKSSFWKDRAPSVNTLNQIFYRLWSRIDFTNLSHYQTQRIHFFFSSLEELINQIKQYGNPSIQWNRFKLFACKEKLTA